MKKYPHQNLSLKDLKGEYWKHILGYEGYFMISNLGRVKRLEYEMQYSDGVTYRRREKIMKPQILKAKNEFKNDYTNFLYNKFTLNKIVCNLSMARTLYNYFIAPFNLDDSNIVIVCKDGDGLNVSLKNLLLATLSDKGKLNFARGRTKSIFQNPSDELKEKQRKGSAKAQGKPVTQYSMRGKKIKSYSNAAEAEAVTGIWATAILKVRSGKAITAGGYVWRPGNEKRVDVELFVQQRKAGHRVKNGQKVTQYDLKGNKIAQYPSISDAEAASGANGGTIRDVLRGKFKSTKGFFWKKGYGKDKIDLSNYKWGHYAISGSLSIKVNQLSLTGKFIKSYPSIKDAAFSVNVSPTVIGRVCQGTQKKSRGFKWEYA
jgi:NUMOD4 motif/NUMOD1 domain